MITEICMPDCSALGTINLKMIASVHIYKVNNSQYWQSTPTLTITTASSITMQGKKTVRLKLRCLLAPLSRWGSLTSQRQHQQQLRCLCWESALPSKPPSHRTVIPSPPGAHSLALSLCTHSGIHFHIRWRTSMNVLSVLHRYCSTVQCNQIKYSTNVQQLIEETAAVVAGIVK